MSTAETATARAEALDALLGADSLILATHEHPDGDAIGSLLALGWLLEGLGKDVAVHIGPDDLPMPYEYDWLDVSAVTTAVPDELSERVVVLLDCGNAERCSLFSPDSLPPTLVNIDHHHDNTAFGSVNYVDSSASCTAEIVWDLIGGLGAELTPPVAEALYVGLVTDTGRFMYSNTDARSHRMAEELLATGIDHNLIYRRIYERLPGAKLKLFARGLSAVQRPLDGALTISFLTAADFEETGASSDHTEGIVDFLRAVDGTRVAALVRELGDSAPGEWRVSLRSSDGAIDVSRIAREGGGGGHAAAAGFRTTMAPDELLVFLSEQVAGQQ
ncbi:MAG: DHH family phosphoesterase [Solirubrobacterales bacterium]